MHGLCIRAAKIDVNLYVMVDCLELSETLCVRVLVGDTLVRSQTLTEMIYGVA